MNDALLRKVSRTIDRQAMLDPRDSVLVAVSGGPDSVALLAALVALSHGGWRIGVGHVNHRLRGRDSERDQGFVERLARDLGVEFIVIDKPVRAGANLEERAREARYRALAAVAHRGRFRRIATGHTLDDQAETVLEHLIRGSGIGGLRAIAPVRTDGVVRPLLDVSRAEVERFLERRGLGFRRDRSNWSPRFTRNRIRRRLLPLIEREFQPAVRSALGRFADLARDDESVLAELAERQLKLLSARRGLDVGGFGRLPAALQRRVVRGWLAAERGDLRGIALGHVERVREIALGGRDGQSVSLPRGSVSRAGGKLRWRLKPAVVKPFGRRLEMGGRARVGNWRIDARVVRDPPKPGPWRAVFDQTALQDGRLGVRSLRPGDRIRPLGLGGTKKLQDVFVDAKVPRESRASWPIIHLGSAILWVPGLARSEFAPVASRSRRFLVIEAHQSR